MDGEMNTKEVRFDLYCNKCKHKDTLEKDDPCYDCLEVPMRYASHKPEKFEEKD